MKCLLTAIPFIWIIAALPFVNTFHPQVAGLPFLAFWIQAGVIVTVVRRSKSLHKRSLRVDLKTRDVSKNCVL